MKPVPCNGCTACCKGPGRGLCPLDLDDDPEAYETFQMGSRHYLAQKVDGTCIYLGAHGCAIYERRPNVCRRFDCREHPDHYMPQVRLAAAMKREAA